jgi:hypothetical protein
MAHLSLSRTLGGLATLALLSGGRGEKSASGPMQAG